MEADRIEDHAIVYLVTLILWKGDRSEFKKLERVAVNNGIPIQTFRLKPRGRRMIWHPMTTCYGSKADA